MGTTREVSGLPAGGDSLRPLAGRRLITHFPHRIWPKSNGPHVGVWQRLDSYIALGAEVTLVTPGASRPKDWQWSEEAKAYVAARGIRLELVPCGLSSVDFWIEAAWRIAAQRLGLVVWPRPDSWYFWRPALFSRWRQLLRQEKFDLAVVNYANWAPLVAMARRAGLKTVIEMHDFLRQQYLVRTEIARGRPPTKRRLERFFEVEMARLGTADLIVAVNRAEAEMARRETGREVIFLTNGLREPDRTATPAPSDVLCVGSDSETNKEGLTAFLRGSWPLIRQEIPHATLTVCGGVGRAVAPGTPGATWIQYAPDLTPHYLGAKLVLLTTTAGSGLKIKAVEALAHRACIVAHPNSVEGIPFVAGVHGLVAHDLSAAGPSVAALLKDEPRRAAMADAAGRLFASEFSFERTKQQLGEAVGRLFKGNGTQPSR